ncbi:hypothetical protein EDB80DRAFT_818253 [Ilyonectria destructans]|nr:hypothetical protein EDB80DRAFT_818253 [Ilyonectria destructans]
MQRLLPARAAEVLLAIVLGKSLARRPAEVDRSSSATGHQVRRVIKCDSPLLVEPAAGGLRRFRPMAKPKAEPLPYIYITIKKQTGIKVITKITNLEFFFINLQLFAPEVQKKCARSASIGEASGSKPGLMEVVVQGDQRKVLVGDILPRRGIDAKWVDIVDKTRAKKKK